MKVGLFISRDDGRISQTVGVDLLAEEFSYLPVVKVYDNFFKYKDQQNMLKTVKENQLEAVVFAGNSPKYFDKVLGGSTVLKAVKSCGVNANKIVFANIKEQVALAHRGENEKATQKAQLLINVALAKAEMSHDIKSRTIAPRHSVMVVGTTAGGIIAAKNLLAKGYKVYLVEKGPSLRNLGKMEQDLLPALSAVQADDRAHMLLETDIMDVSGWCGEYNVVLNNKSGQKEIIVGGIILCLADDTEWIQALRPKMQLDVDEEGLLRGKQREHCIGQTGDPGIWFIPYKKGADLYSAETCGADMAVLSLSTTLDKDEIEHPVMVSEVDENVCGGCGTCVKTCAFSASSIDLVRNVSVIDPKRCKGCGNCVVACPTGARDLVNFPEKYLIKAIDILSSGTTDHSEPKVLAILCNGCGYQAADAAGELSSQILDNKYSPNVMPVRVECGGNVDTQYILKAFSKGFNGVVISVCRDGQCHHVFGNTDMERRLGLFREVLRSRNINAERLRIIHVWPNEGELFTQEMKSFYEELQTMNREEGRY